MSDAGAWREALKFFDGDREALFALIRNSFQLDDRNALAELVDVAAESEDDRSAELRFWRIAVAAIQQDFATALNGLEELKYEHHEEITNPWDVDHLLIECNYRLGKLDRAAELAQLFSDEYDDWLPLIACQIASGNTDEAYESLQQQVAWGYSLEEFDRDRILSHALRTPAGKQVREKLISELRQ